LQESAHEEVSDGSGNRETNGWRFRNGHPVGWRASPGEGEASMKIWPVIRIPELLPRLPPVPRLGEQESSWIEFPICFGALSQREATKWAKLLRDANIRPAE
jgi:hypothetical protein